MTKIYYEKDCNLTPLKNKTVAILGYGNQGEAHALNLRDSGVKVIVGLRPESRSRAKASAEGLEVLPVEEASAKADVIMMLINDHVQKEVYERSIFPRLEPGKSLVFAHGFNIHFGQIEPPEIVDVFMVAPKGPGRMVRNEYLAGGGVPCLIAVHQDPSGRARETALAYAAAIGGARSGVLETTFKEETETDLFGEQAVLCGGAAELVKAGFETLVQAGYQPEIAYFECLHELKLIVDLIYRGGLNNMRDCVSDTAEFGDYMSGRRIISEATRAEMKRILGEVQDGTFARNWILENQAGRPAFQARRQAERGLLIETVGKKLRSLMKYLEGKS